MTSYKDAKKPGENGGRKIRVLMVGPSGAGKTTGMMTMPGRKLLIDMDGRTDELDETLWDVKVMKFQRNGQNGSKPWIDLEMLLDDLMRDGRDGKVPYESIIFDSLTSMGKLAMDWSLVTTPGAKGPGNSPAMQHYTPQMTKMEGFIMRSLGLPFHVGYTGHFDMYENPKTKMLEYWPTMYGKLRTQIGSWFNETYEASREVVDGKSVYLWYTGGGKSQKPFLKSSMNRLGGFWTDPIVVDFGPKGTTKTGFEVLLKKRYGGEG